MSLRAEINDQLLFDSPWKLDPNDPLRARRVSMALWFENEVDWLKFGAIKLRLTRAVTR